MNMGPGSSMSLENEPGAEPSTPSGGASALLEAHKETATGGQPGSGPRKRGRHPRGCACGNCKQSGGGSPQASPPVSSPVPSLFNEENTGRLVALPFTMAAIATDYDGWRLDAREQKELSASGSVALNEWVRVEPKWVALSLFSLSLIGVAVSKAIGYQAEKRARDIKNHRDRTAGKAGDTLPRAIQEEHGKETGKVGGFVALVEEGPKPLPS